MDAAHSTLAELLGGPRTVEAVVDSLYARMVADPTVRAYFDDVDLAVQRRHMTAFLVAVLSHPAGRSRVAEQVRLRTAHAHLHIGDEAFDQTAGHLLDALAEFPVEPDLVDEVIGRIAALRPYVVEERSGSLTAGESGSRPLSGQGGG